MEVWKVFIKGYYEVSNLGNVRNNIGYHIKISKLFNVSSGTIRSVLLGNTWKHVL